MHCKCIVFPCRCIVSQFQSVVPCRQCILFRCQTIVDRSKRIVLHCQTIVDCSQCIVLYFIVSLLLQAFDFIILDAGRFKKLHSRKIIWRLALGFLMY